METPPDVPLQQLKLFDTKRYIEHRFLLPNVIEFPKHIVDNNLHDSFIDTLEADEVRCRIFDFPRKITPPDQAA